MRDSHYYRIKARTATTPNLKARYRRLARTMAEAEFQNTIARDKITKALRGQGWVFVDSSVLGDRFVVVNPKRDPVLPEALAGEPVWTTTELERLGYGDDDPWRMDIAEMRAMNEVKRQLGAELEWVGGNREYRIRYRKQRLL